MQDVISDDAALKNISANVRRLIGDRSFSEIARACCTPDWTCYAATIEKIANGKNMPGAGLLARLAEALGVTPNDLLSQPAAKRRLSKAS